MKTIATYHCGFGSKFGLPRQSGIIPGIKGHIVFEHEYRAREAFRGLESFSHLWLLWKFSESERQQWRPTVRPPRLGGNTRVGVFATRSPFRPNPIGMSCVKLDDIVFDDASGPIIEVSGGDLADGTPIYDIKPYLPFTDKIDGAKGGLPDAPDGNLLTVEIPAEMLSKIPSEDIETIRSILAGDPRPAYQDDRERIYGFTYNGMEIRFTVEGSTLKMRSAERMK